jgi:7-cyano-7-deazaguanine reductase
MVDYSDTGLGKSTIYNNDYNPGLLQPIPREKARQIQYSKSLPFKGVDIWTAFEISWLNSNGLPQLAIGEFIFPCDSEAIIESKSFKLYLNSFIQTVQLSKDELVATLISDLSACCGATVDVVLLELSEYAGLRLISEPQGKCIDHRELTIKTYLPDSGLLSCDESFEVAETLYSHLLKTNCPVTDQPDWASIYVNYAGPKIDEDGLLRYIVSYRQHQDFHEQCVEQIFNDIKIHCKPEELSVYARYMRRGGLDINPFRSTSVSMPLSHRHVRQ